MSYSRENAQERHGHFAFVGCAGVPNRYGGFESFVEHCGPSMARQVASLSVTCDASLYPDRIAGFKGMQRVFIRVKANGASSVLHDLLAFFSVFRKSTHIIVLGVSGGMWFPLFRLLCDVTDKRLLVNVDGVEWRRSKFGPGKRWVLRVFDHLAQRFAHTVIFDNPALEGFLIRQARAKAVNIAYSGDHVPRGEGQAIQGTALSICRIEPENNLEVLIQGTLGSKLNTLTIVGNWSNSMYGRELKDRYRHEPRLRLLDPIYEADALCQLRESCEIYLHGHSVGGTNPSLVEMLFHDCRILCFDVQYNRETAQDCAQYFRDAQDLADKIDHGATEVRSRAEIRQRYTAESIAGAYIQAARR